MKAYSPFAPIVAGLVLVAVGRLAQRLMPLLGRMAYQAAAAGSHSPADCQLPLPGYYLLSLALVVLGIVLAVVDRRRNTQA